MATGTPPTPVRDLPLGFFVMGMLSLAFSMFMGMIVVSDLLSGGGPILESYAERGVMVLLTCLGVIVTEGLWTVRPFAFRASAAMAATFAAWLIGGGVANPEEMIPRLWGLLFSAFLLVPVLVYIHRQSRRIWPPAATPVAVPGARP